MRNVLRNTNEVAHYWANKVQPRGRSGNVYFVGDVIYSYGLHFAMARHLPNGRVAMTTRKYSITTTEHMSIVRRAIGYGRSVLFVKFPEGTAADQYDATIAEVRELMERSLKARTKKAMYVSEASALIESFNEFAISLGEDVRISRDLVGGMTEQEVRQAFLDESLASVERIQARQRAEERKNETQIAEWVNGERDHCPRTAEPKLRVKGDQVETSWSASVPVEDALRLWRLIKVVKGSRHSHIDPSMMIGAYRLTRICVSGDVQIGCHNIPYSEIERIADVLGVGSTEMEVA